MSGSSSVFKTVAIKNTLRQCVKRAGHVPERLPGEMELAQKFNVSRTTVRIAIEGLERAGYIIRIPGRKGAFTNPALAGAVPFVVGIVVDSGVSVYLKSEHARILSSVILSLSEFFTDYEYVMLNGDTRSQRISELENYAFDAVIYFNDNLPESIEALNLLLAKGLPLVIVDAIDRADVPRCVSNSISYDFGNIGYRHFRYVKTCGAKNVIYIGVQTATFQTFQRLMSEHGIPLRHLAGGDDFESELTATIEQNPPDAIFVTDSAKYQSAIDILQSCEAWRKIKILGTFNTLLVRLKKQNPELDIILETGSGNTPNNLAQYISGQVQKLLTGEQKYFANMEHKLEPENLS